MTSKYRWEGSKILEQHATTPPLQQFKEDVKNVAMNLVKI